MNQSDYVYCTRCKNFNLDFKGECLGISSMDCIIDCKYKDDCYLWDCEDGRRYELRKHYEPIEE